MNRIILQDIHTSPKRKNHHIFMVEPIMAQNPSMRFITLAVSLLSVVLIRTIAIDKIPLLLPQKILFN